MSSGLGQGSGTSHTPRTLEEMEQDMKMKMMWINPEEARLLMNTSSHSMLTGDAVPDATVTTTTEPAVEEEANKVAEVGDTPIEELYRKDKSNSKSIIGLIPSPPITISLAGGVFSKEQLEPEESTVEQFSDSSDAQTAPVEDNATEQQSSKNNSPSEKPPSEDNPKETSLTNENAGNSGKDDPAINEKGESETKPTTMDVNNTTGSPNKPKKSWSNSKEIFTLPNVQLFSINPVTNTAKSRASGELRIIEIPGRMPDDATKDDFNQLSPPPAFLQIGDSDDEVWLYPLIPYNSPVYRSEEGHYIFPDVKSDKAGAATGLVLPTNTFLFDIDEFESILKTFTGLDEFISAPPMMFGNTSLLIDQARKEDEFMMDEAINDVIKIASSANKAAKPKIEAVKNKDVVSIPEISAPKPNPTKKKPDIFNCNGIGNGINFNNMDFSGFSHRGEQEQENHSAQYLSTKIADGIVAGAEIITRGVSYGASKTSEILDQGTGLIKSFSQGPTTSPKRIHKKLHNSVKAAKNYTGQFVELSSYVVEELGNATVALATYLSPYLHQTTTTLVKKATGSNPDESNYIVGNFLEVTTGTLQGMHMVYSGLHKAAKILARSITDNTVDVITHYYGPKAGEIIDDAAETVGNIALGGVNTQALTPHSVMQRAAKDTGIVLLTKETTPTDS